MARLYAPEGCGAAAAAALVDAAMQLAAPLLPSGDGGGGGGRGGAGGGGGGRRNVLRVPAGVGAYACTSGGGGSRVIHGMTAPDAPRHVFLHPCSFIRS
jgi:hypothetical protein